MQVCRPLYEGAYTYRHGGLSDLSPLQMFFPPAMWKGGRSRGLSGLSIRSRADRDSVAIVRRINVSAPAHCLSY